MRLLCLCQQCPLAVLFQLSVLVMLLQCLCQESAQTAWKCECLHLQCALDHTAWEG